MNFLTSSLSFAVLSCFIVSSTFAGNALDKPLAALDAFGKYFNNEYIPLVNKQLEDPKVAKAKFGAEGEKDALEIAKLRKDLGPKVMKLQEEFVKVVQETAKLFQALGEKLKKISPADLAKFRQLYVTFLRFAERNKEASKKLIELGTNVIKSVQQIQG